MNDNSLQLTEGMDVLDAGARHVGTVKEIRETDIAVGRTLQPAVYVPREAIQSVTANQVTLTLTADQVDDIWWATAGEKKPVDLSGSYD